MKWEKKTALLCIVALTIGIATALPLIYFTNLKTNTTPQTEPCLDATILYANILQYPKNNYMPSVNVVANLTLTPELVNLKDADAKIEVYKFHVYTDQGPIANMVYTFEVARDIPDSKAPNGVTKAIRGSSDGNYIFADNTIYNLTDVIGPIDGGAMWCLNLENDPSIKKGWTFATVSGFLSAEKDERAAQALINLSHAQTIYVDVIRVMTLSCSLQVNSDSSIASTTNTLTKNEIMDHIELSRVDFGFASGDVPDFMYGDTQFWFVVPQSLSSNMQPTSQVEATDFIFRRLKA